MIKTIRLFDESSYETEFCASVLSAEKTEGTTFRVVLDRTLFFPKEGGQSSDTGILYAKNRNLQFFVSQVSEDNGGIFHEIDLSHPANETIRESGSLPLLPGERIEGRIDFERRFSNMQNHTGEHILSGLLHRYWSSENTGFHLSDNIVTLDTSKQLKKEDIRELEKKANAAVYENIPVSCRYYDPSELKEAEYRSKKEFTENIRLVTIPGIDICACCAPHVKATGEIGLIKIVHFANYKGGTRLVILSGKRAFSFLSELQDTADELALRLSTGLDRLKGSVEKLIKDGNDYKEKYSKTLEELWKLRIRTLNSTILFTEDELDAIAQRRIVNQMTESNPGISAVFVGTDQKGYRFILSWRDNDARIAADLLKERFSAKCGGSGEMIQGSISAPEEEILKSLSQLSYCS